MLGMRNNINRANVEVDSEQDVGKEMPLPLSEARELLDIVCLVNVLLQNVGNLSRAAEELGIARRTFYDLMEKYGISCSEGKLSIELTPPLGRLEVRAPCLGDYGGD